MVSCLHFGDKETKGCPKAEQHRSSVTFNFVRHLLVGNKLNVLILGAQTHFFCSVLCSLEWWEPAVSLLLKLHSSPGANTPTDLLEHNKPKIFSANPNNCILRCTTQDTGAGPPSNCFLRSLSFSVLQSVSVRLLIQFPWLVPALGGSFRPPERRDWRVT